MYKKKLSSFFLFKEAILPGKVTVIASRSRLYGGAHGAAWRQECELLHLCATLCCAGGGGWGKIFPENLHFKTGRACVSDNGGQSKPSGPAEPASTRAAMNIP